MNEKKLTTLMHGFLHWEETQPDAVYFTQPQPDGEVVDTTWKEAGSQARRMAAYLKSLELPAKSHIAILGKNSPHWIMADLAIWMAGHVSVPLYPTMNVDTVQYIIEHANVQLLFIGNLDGKADGWNAIRTAVPPQLPVVALPMSPAADVLQWNALIDKTPALQEVHVPAPDSLATIIYTSGTTGRPKGVMHSFANMVAYATTVGEFCGLTPADRLLSYLPLAHIAERAFVESNSLFSGCRVYFNDSLETFAQDLRRARPTSFISVPRLWTKFYLGICGKLPASQQSLLAEQSAASSLLKKKILTMLGLEEVRTAFTGAAPLPVEIVSWYRNLGLELLDVYGMTEDFANSHYSRPGQVRLGYCGQPLPGVESRIADDGEIQVRSPGQTLGYYKQPELTAASMTPDGFFRTGDRGEKDELGRLKITGRVKELFKTSKGKYVAPAPIENKLSHPKIEAVCVTGPGQAQPFALLMPSPDARRELQDPAGSAALQIEFHALLERVNAALEDHEKLDYLVLVNDIWTTDNGFLTPTLKIKRGVIEERYLAKAGGWSGCGRPVIVETDQAGSRIE